MQIIFWFCLNLRLLSFAIENTLDTKMLQVNYPFPLTDLHQNRKSLRPLEFRDVYKKIIWFCMNLRLLSIAIEKITLDLKKTVDGKLPLSVNRFSPKTISLENSIIQGCLQKNIWFCLNLRLLSFSTVNTRLKHKTLQVNYPFPLTELHQNQ